MATRYDGTESGTTDLELAPGNPASGGSLLGDLTALLNGTTPHHQMTLNAVAIKSSTPTTSTTAIRLRIIPNGFGAYSSISKTTVRFRSTERA